MSAIVEMELNGTMRVTFKTASGLRGWWLWVIAKVWPRQTSVMACGNRTSMTTRLGSLEVTLLLRDTSRQDGYSREELVEMLETVRKHEALQGWKVPEPAVSEGSLLS
jgi:hypothetical protein